VGPEGPQGPEGPEGPEGPPGTSKAFAVANEGPIDVDPAIPLGELMGLPAGDYVVMAKAQFRVGDSAETRVECTLEVGAFTDQAAVFLSSSASVATVPFLATAHLPAGGGAVLSCLVVGDPAFATRVKLTAMLVDEVVP
jgi:hypothetical protein